MSALANMPKRIWDAEGWYYSQTKKAVEVKYANPGKDYNLTVSFEQFDLIGM